MRFNANYNRPDLIPVSYQRYAFLDAIERWNDVLQAEGANIRFQYDGPCEIEDYLTAKSGENAAYFDVFFDHY